MMLKAAVMAVEAGKEKPKAVQHCSHHHSLPLKVREGSQSLDKLFCRRDKGKKLARLLLGAEM